MPALSHTVQDLRERPIVGFPSTGSKALNCLATVSSKLPCKQALDTGPRQLLPRGSLRPFEPGQSSNPYPDHYSPAFAFSAFSYPLPQQLSLQVTCRGFDTLKSRRGIGLTTFPVLPTHHSDEPIRLAPVYSPMAP